MSDERMDELGLPRRAFMKRAAAVFVAPVIVSFGLDGVAEARTRSLLPNLFPNQMYPNQAYANQTYPNQTFGNQHHGHHRHGHDRHGHDRHGHDRHSRDR